MSFSSSFHPVIDNNGDNTVTTAATVPTEAANPAHGEAPPSTTTTTVDPEASSSPFLPPQQPGASFTGGASPPLIAGFISIGAFAVAIISICAWCKFMRRSRVPRDYDSGAGSVLTRFVDHILPDRLTRRRGHGDGHGHGHGHHVHHHHRRGRRRWRQGQGRGRSSELSRAKPEMFDAWIENARWTSAVDSTLTWEATESVPLSATLFATGSLETGMAEVSSRAGGESVEDEDEEKRCPSVQQMRQAAIGSSSTLQVAVFLQMPSPPPPSHTVTEALQNDISVRGELAIGVVETPWTREHPSSREGEETATS